ncbi:uncharacterized protein EHS24_008303 [Apiotrichum porosum]|uniref:Uncharacterized protein n=1 Tax=Apiotrichum porosum TaxID=105984 RepID=A0A427XTD2_9TREE|nr:uncharacterized protein EHS24_008303 [Apiotrichum porosum]RSH82099.1 hypothetical protein EHS24_008303 [Apiotrichum porosum]
MTAPTTPPAKAHELDDDNKAEAQHLDMAVKYAGGADAEASGALAMERLKHEMGLWQSLRNYKGAVFWSLSVSMCIVSVFNGVYAYSLIMEGYDLALVSNLIALKAFR